MQSVDLSTLANVTTALTVLVATIFGLQEFRVTQRARQERAAYAAVAAIMTPEWIRSVVRVQSIPDHATLQDIESDPRTLEAAHSVGIILEGLGYSVYKRLVPLAIVDELLGGAVRVAWQKLQSYVAAERERSGSQRSWEWFQWLARQLERHGTAKTNLALGAHEAYDTWRP